MGRHFEVRAAAMQATAKQKSALYMRASKEIYTAAKSGEPNPEMNLSLRSAIEKYRKDVPKDVIDRAIEKAKGGTEEAYIAGRYEFFGPGASMIIIDTLTDNVNRAFSDVRTACTRHGGKQGNVAFCFENYGVLSFKGSNRDEIEENLILSDVDVQEVKQESEDLIVVLTAPEAFGDAQKALDEMGIKKFEKAQLMMIPNDWVELNEEDLETFKGMLQALDEAEDVQEVYHNVDNI